MRLPVLLVVATVAAIVVPSIAEAQRGGRGGIGGARGGIGRRGGRGGEDAGGRGGLAARVPDAKELEKLSPAQAVLAKRSELGLSDPQAATVKAAGDRILERNAPLLARYDSLRRDLRPARGAFAGDRQSAEADSARATMATQFRAMRTVIDSLYARRRADVREVLDALTDPRQIRDAAELINAQERAFLAILPRQVPARG